MASVDFKKGKSAGDFAAMARHDDREQRPLHAHGNPDLDTGRTHLNRQLQEQDRQLQESISRHRREEREAKASLSRQASEAREAEEAARMLPQLQGQVARLQQEAMQAERRRDAAVAVYDDVRRHGHGLVSDFDAVVQDEDDRRLGKRLREQDPGYAERLMRGGRRIGKGIGGPGEER